MTNTSFWGQMELEDLLLYDLEDRGWDGMVEDRRSADKVARLVRWAGVRIARPGHLADSECWTRSSYFSRLLGDTLIGRRHAHGRVHRYGGLAIRRNLAHHHWAEMHAAAASGRHPGMPPTKPGSPQRRTGSASSLPTGSLTVPPGLSGTRIRSAMKPASRVEAIEMVIFRHACNY